MNILVLFFLGVLQGLTEFLPVSSSGHLVLFSKLFSVDESLFLSILLHCATLLSILVCFYKDIFEMIRHPFSRKTMLLAVATIPTCLVVIVLLPIIKLSFGGGALAISFFLSAVLLYLSEEISKRKGQNEIDFKSAFLIGLAQGFAVFPGISRSGTTISAGLIQGKNKKQVAKFSFLMSIPIIFASLVMEIFEIFQGEVSLSFSFGELVFSFVTAFIVGVFAIKFVMKLTEKTNLKLFSIYLVIVSVLTLFVM